MQFLALDNAVLNRIFNKRLQNNFIAAAGKRLGRNIHRIIEFAFKAHALNFQITFRMLRFLRHKDQLFPAGNSHAEQFCKSRRHFRGFVRFSHFAHPHNGIKRIVQKVRIDLISQNFQMTFMQLALLCFHLSQQILHHFHVHAERFRKSADFFNRTFFGLIPIAVNIFFKRRHFLRQIFNRNAQPLGKDHCDSPRSNHGGAAHHGDQNKFLLRIHR